jgi:hypothetical protein
MHPGHASKLSEDFRASSERLKGELNSLQQQISLLQTLPRPVHGQAAARDDGDAHYLDDAVESLEHKYGGVESPSHERSGGAAPLIDRRGFAERGNQLESAIKVRCVCQACDRWIPRPLTVLKQERDAHILALTAQLDSLRREEDTKTAVWRRHLMLLGLPSEVQNDNDSDESVVAYLLSWRSHVNAELTTARNEAEVLARELHLARESTAQLQAQHSVTEAKTVADAARYTSSLAALEKKHAYMLQEYSALLQQAQSRIHELEEETHRMLQAAHKSANMESEMQQLFDKLEVRDANELVTAHAKLQDALAAVPSMVACLRDVCDIIASSAPLVDSDMTIRTARDAPAVLKHWVARLRDTKRLDAFREAVALALAKRPGASSMRRASEAELLTAIAEGVTAHQRIHAADSTFLRRERNAQMEAAISHMQLLFDIPSLAGVIPCMTRVHAKLCEAATFHKDLREALRIDSAAPPHAVLQQVRRLAAIDAHER